MSIYYAMRIYGVLKNGGLMKIDVGRKVLTQRNIIWDNRLDGIYEI